MTLMTRATTVRLSLRDLERDFDKSEDDIKALQSVGQIVGEVLKQLDEERCQSPPPSLELFPHPQPPLT
ncbi:MAG: hypothetical protein LBE67_18445 [Kocuria palustris]|jgi:ATP-dependent 26S proteasome regulatory subunit|nr:hypothetical protein [Kocuria palustris]